MGKKHISTDEHRATGRLVLLQTFCRGLLVLAALVLAASSTAAQFEFSSPVEEPDSDLVTVTSVFSVSAAAPGSTHEAATVITIEDGWHINSAHPYQDWLIPAELSFDTVAPCLPQTVVYPDGHDVMLMDEAMSMYSGRVMVRFQVEIDAEASPGQHRVPVRFTCQPCNNTQCLPPQTVRADLDLRVGSDGVPVNDDVFAAASAPAEHDVATGGSTSESGDLQRLIDEYGTWGYLIALGLAFITGLLLSFSPCTYPMVPITVSIFAGQSRTVAKGFLLSLVYVGSMAVTYGIMGLVVSLVGGVFGAWLASPPVVIAIAVVLVIFSLSMFGLYELQVPGPIRRRLGTARGGGGILSTMVLGVVAALVVSPCVGPFVAGILLYIAAAGSPVIGFLVLFVFAMGLGTLYVLIGTFSTALNQLPRSGEWMESVKKFFGFVLLLMSLYFVRTILSPIVTATLAGLLLTAFGVFGGGLDRLTPQEGFFPRLKKFVGILAFLVGIYLLGGTLISQGLILPPASQWLSAAATEDATTAEHLIDWRADLEAGLARARAEHRPVLIDTWATWCVNCRVLDRKTFGNARVAEEAKRFVAIRVQLETAGAPATKDFMDRFDMKHYSLPTTLLLDSNGRVREVIKGVIGPDEMIARMQQVS